ncbi:MAG: alanine racemase [Patescibacteria group bacterium]
MSLRGAKTWIEVSHAAMEQNIAALRTFMKPESTFCAVIKANAYGCGMREAATIATECGIDTFAVDSIDEAVGLRELLPKATIFILGFTVSERLNDVVAIDAIQTVYNPETIVEITKHALHRHRPARVSIKIETGLHRQGVNPRGLVSLLDAIHAAGDSILVEGVGTHFACAEEPTDPMNAYQMKHFAAAVQSIRDAGYTPRYEHIACSAAAMVDRETQGTMSRIGIALYGLWSSKTQKRQVVLGRQNIELHPVLSWKTRIAQIKDIPPGATVSYGCTYTANRPLRIAVLPVGYYDGYDRGLSNKGEVLIRGRRCPVLGIVCMNMIMVDVSAVPSVAVDDVATLLGRDGMNAITAEDIAAIIATSHYEVVTRINPLLPRIIV